MIAAASAFHVIDLTRSFGSAMPRLRNLTGLALPPLHSQPLPRYRRPLPPGMSTCGTITALTLLYRPSASRPVTGGYMHSPRAGHGMGCSSRLQAARCECARTADMISRYKEKSAMAMCPDPLSIMAMEASAIP